MRATLIDSATGEWWALHDQSGIHGISRQPPSGVPSGPLKGGWKAAIVRAASGQRPASLPPLCLTGTEFQKKVWAALLKIPVGDTTTYGELARKIGHPGAARAVGSACAANPIPLLIPCHRVLVGGGALGGYSCGLAVKSSLLNMERKPSSPLRACGMSPGIVIPFLLC